MSEEELADLDDDAIAALQNGELSSDIETETPIYDDKYNVKINKRIGKEVKKRKVLEEELQAERSKNKRLQEEIAESRKVLSSFEDQQDEDLKTKADDIKARRDKALDEGDLNTYKDLNDEWTEAQIELRERSRRPKKQAADNDGQDDGGKRNGGSGMSEPASDWVSSNSDWLGQDKSKTTRAQEIERALAHEGYSVHDPELYRELDRRLAREFDDNSDLTIGGDDDLDDEVDLRGQRQSSSAGVPRETGGDDRPSRRGSQKLTRSDLVSMQKYGFDPNSPTDRKAWINRNAEL